MGNELVAEVKESETVWSGSRLLEDGFDLKEAFESNSWVAGGLATAATAADTAAAVMDPLGEALSAGIGWIIEHLSPLKDWLNELAGDSDAVAAAASTWTNIGAKLSSCAGDLEAVCSSRLAGQESLAVATFKSLQAGSASHLRMTGQLAGAISGGLTLASVIVRMVHDMVRDAIADIIGKLTSKAIITAVSLGTASGWAIASLSADVTAWATRLSKEVADVVTSAKNLKGLLSKANRLFDDVAEKFAGMAAMAGQSAAKRIDDIAQSAQHRLDQLGDLLGPMGPQHALAGAPGMTMAQARRASKATPTTHTPKTPKPTHPNPNEGRWGAKLDDAASTTKSASKATDAAADGAKSTSHATGAAADGAKNASHATDAAADGAKGAASAAGAAATSAKRAGKAADAATDGAKSAEHATDAAADGAKGADDAADAAGDAADGARGADDAATDGTKHTDEATEVDAHERAEADSSAATGEGTTQWDDPAKVQEWYDDLPTKTRKASTPAYEYQHRVLGTDVERQLTTDSGDDIWADSVTTDGTITKAWDAKHTEGGDKALYQGKGPEFLMEDFDGEMKRYGEVIRSSGNPVSSLTLVTNTPESVEFLGQRAREILGPDIELHIQLKP